MQKVIVVRKLKPKFKTKAVGKAVPNAKLDAINRQIRAQYLFNQEAFMKLQDEKIARGEMSASEKWWPDGSTT